MRYNVASSKTYIDASNGYNKYYGTCIDTLLD